MRWLAIVGVVLLVWFLLAFVFAWGWSRLPRDPREREDE